MIVVRLDVTSIRYFYNLNAAGLQICSWWRWAVHYIPWNLSTL